MNARDIMTADVVTLSPDATFPEIAQTFLDEGISGAPVVDDDGHMVGLITEADLMPKEASKEAPRRALAFLAALIPERDRHWMEQAHGLRARDVMTTEIETATPDESVDRLARRMLRTGHRRLPVVQDGKLLGIVARADIIGVFNRTDTQLRDSVGDLLRRCMYLPPFDEIIVAARDGIVTLSGKVRFESDVRVVEAIVASTPGVVAVKNRLAFEEHDRIKTGSYA